MVMGTASDVGKSVVVTGLCRLLARAGVRVAPFKSQNMSNNAAVCRGGGEIGRAQAVQAEAAGLEATADMNPVLLKPEGENSCQVVIGGRARFQMTTRDHSYYRERAWPEIVASYNRLAAQFEVIIVEGAGGAAEVNLRDRDVANWRVAELAEGLIVNKFRGDAGLLADGLRIIEDRTGVPVLGILPYVGDLDIPQEDSASLKTGTTVQDQRPISVGVVRFPGISNHTDFEPLAREPDVDLQYFDRPERVGHVDILCLPGSKNTIADLHWLRECGWDGRISAHYRGGGSIVGICGGYQMLGHVIGDPYHVESSASAASGLGMLEIETVFAAEKITATVSAIDLSSRLEISGYEIHCGRVIRLDQNPAFRIRERKGRSVDEPEGARSDDGRVLGTSIHGLFDEPRFRRHYLNQIREQKGLTRLDTSGCGDAESARMCAYDRFADLLANNLDISSVAALAGLSLSNLKMNRGAAALGKRL